MATNTPQTDSASKAPKETVKPAAVDKRRGEAMLRRHGFDPANIGDDERESLRQLGIDADTYERKALTWGGAIQEFGKPIGPRLYNEVHTAAFGPVSPGRNDLNLMSLDDRWLSPRRSDPTRSDFETEREFEERKQKFAARREKVLALIAAAEKEVEKEGK